MGSDQTADERATDEVSDGLLAAAIAQAREDAADLEAERDRHAGGAGGDILGRLKAKRETLAKLEAERDKRAVRLDLRPMGEMYGPEWLTEAPPARKALLRRDGKPFVVQGKVGLLLAPGGTGKTWAFTQLAVAVATGGRWFDTYEATKGRVFLALGEEDADEVRRRLYDVAKGLGLSEYERAELARNLTVWGMAGKSVALLGKNAAGEPVPSPWFAELRAALKAGGPWRCVLLDPWSRWGGPDVEKDNHAATRAVELLEELTQLPGAPTVLVAHHTRKGSKEDATSGADADASRGASALVDGVRWVANLVQQKGDTASELPLVFNATKRNHTAPSEQLELVRGEAGVLRPLTPAELGPRLAKREEERKLVEERAKVEAARLAAAAAVAAEKLAMTKDAAAKRAAAPAEKARKDAEKAEKERAREATRAAARKGL